MKKNLSTGLIAVHHGNNNALLLKNDDDSEFPINDPPFGVNIEIQGSNNTLIFGHNLKIEGKLVIDIKGNGNLVDIGAGVVVRRNVHCCIHSGGIGAKGDECTLKIGSNTIFNGGRVFMQLGERKTKILIGKECLFASNIRLMTSDNHLLFDRDSSIRLNPAGDVIIGDNCWICFDSVLLNHSVIPSGSVVAARSLVNRSFDESFVLLAGTPAKIIRKRIGWDIEIEKENESF